MKDKTTTGILALFLGGLWVHKFYLWNSGIWILYLLFCWTFIPSIIWIIEGIIFLSMSENEFNKKYNTNNKDKAKNNFVNVSINTNNSGGVGDEYKKQKERLKQKLYNEIIDVKTYKEERIKQIDYLDDDGVLDDYGKALKTVQEEIKEYKESKTKDIKKKEHK